MIPSTVYVGFFIALLSVLGGFGIGVKWTEHKVLKLRAAHAEVLTSQAQDARIREAKARAEERRVTFRVMETADAANLKAADARRSAAAAAGERDRLRDAYVEFAGRTGGPAEAAPATPGSSPAAGPGLVLARLFDRGTELLQSCAAALDQSRIAGLACERSYDSLTLLSNED